jgi:hypothetical protein
VPLALLVCAAALAALAPGTAPAATAAKSALVVFVPADASQLARVNGLSVGIMSATQGSYRTAQLLLDITQGSRVAASAYPDPPPTLSVKPVGSGATVDGFAAARARAARAPAVLQPGLLAEHVPGGGAYAGVSGVDDIDGAVAAQRAGRIAAVSFGSAPTLLARLAALQRSSRLVVADLPAGGEGVADLRALSLARGPGELLVVVQRVPDERGGELLWTALGGLAGGGGRVLSSRTTNQRGLVSAIDLSPTILAHLGEAVPSAMRGTLITTDGPLRQANLPALMGRLEVLGGRRLRALACLLGAWALLLLASAPRPRARARVMRVGALGFLWTPVAVLIPAATEPSAPVEYLSIVLACLALGTLTDRLLPWPRAPLAPALVAITVLVVDALAGTQLLMRSLLGPDPILGARFYGIGNELKSALAVLVLAALAAALYPARRTARGAAVMLGGGVVLAVVEGSARIGAGVGGVILVTGAFALAAVMMLPGTVTRRRLLIVTISPLAGLLALAAIDLATAHGGGHYTGSILHARSAGDLRDVIVRRYTAAWDELENHAMPAATVFALLYAVLGLRRRGELLAPIGQDPAWTAALAGGLTAGVLGALAEDSGPLLLVVAVFTLGCVVSYLWGRPPQHPRTPEHATREPAITATRGR